MELETIKQGTIVRDISSDYDGPTYDVLFTNNSGLSRYSNDVFDTEAEAASLAEKCCQSLVDTQGWDYYQHTEQSSYWKTVRRYD